MLLRGQQMLLRRNLRCLGYSEQFFGTQRVPDKFSKGQAEFKGQILCLSQQQEQQLEFVPAVLVSKSTSSI